MPSGVSYGCTTKGPPGNLSLPPSPSPDHLESPLLPTLLCSSACPQLASICPSVPGTVLGAGDSSLHLTQAHSRELSYTPLSHPLGPSTQTHSHAQEPPQGSSCRQLTTVFIREQLCVCLLGDPFLGTLLKSLMEHCSVAAGSLISMGELKSGLGLQLMTGVRK